MKKIDRLLSEGCVKPI